MARLKDVAKKYSVNRDDLQTWVRNSKYKGKIKIICNEWNIDDKDIPEVMEAFSLRFEDEAKIAAEKAAIEAKRQEREIEKRKILITSGYNFEGYKIIKYSGYISGDDAINVDRGFTVFGASTNNTADDLMGALVKIRRKALDELKEAALNLGCNAVIGVDFDYLTLDPQTASITGSTVYQPYVFGVTANGNAVVIEKIND